MADGKIYITISDTRKGGSGDIPSPEAEEKKKKEKENPLAKFAQHKFFNFIESQTKQAVNYTINNIGNFTGDYVKQQHIQDTMNIANSLISIGSAAAAGLTYSGGSIYGALIGAGIAVISQGINYGQQYAAGYQENARQNRDVAQLRTRAGLNSTNNGSRGTDQ